MYLTSRGWWFLVLSFGLLTLGLVSPAILPRLGRLLSITRTNPEYYGAMPALVLLGLTLVLWFAWEWLVFALRCRFAAAKLVAYRQVRDERGPVENLWAGRIFRVRVRVRMTSWLGLPYLLAEERVPWGLEVVEGTTRREAALRRDEPLDLEYRIRCPAVGRVRFEGMRIRMADFQGFFYHALFVHGVAELRVLPVLADDIGQPSTHKRHNLLPPPGIHRLRQPGSGGELLDLRDYLPGDPPKTIAWKVSARRDRLVTKLFENEVPVRCTLFVDTSNSVRLGPPGRNALARLVEIAAAIAQANTSIRDLTGLCLFDEQKAHMTRPARTARHLASLMNLLADSAGQAPTTGLASVEALMRLAYPFVKETYPELMQPAINHVPFWLARDWPPSAHQGAAVGTGKRVGSWIAWGFATVLFLGLATAEWTFLSFMYDDVLEGFEYMLPPADFVSLIYGIGLLFLYLPFVRFICQGLPMLFSGRASRLARWRKRLAAVIAVHFHMAPGTLALLLEDNEQFSLCMQRYLAEHHVPYQLPLYDEKGQYRFASPAKVGVLATAVLQAVGRGHDNELFVLLVDLMELSDQLEPLLAAVRVALARHHQVVMICPWPPEVPPPSAEPPDEGRELAALLAARNIPTSAAVWHVQSSLERLLGARLNREFHRLKHVFGRLGVPVVSAQDKEPIRLIVERLERLRGLRMRR